MRTRARRTAIVAAAVAALGAMLVAPATAQSEAAAEAEWQTVARWEMNEKNGDTMVDAATPRQNGVIGDKVKLDGKTYKFLGKKKSMVVVKKDQAQFNPNKKSFRVSMRVKPDPLSKLPKNTALNIAQKGLFANSGGFWKLEYSTDPSILGRIRCSVREAHPSGQGRSVGLVSQRIDDGKFHNVTCTIKRHGGKHKLVLTVDGQTKTEKLPKKFGPIKPQQPNKNILADNYGKQVTIGRKPGNFSAGDAFKGKVAWLKIEVRK